VRQQRGWPWARRPDQLWSLSLNNCVAPNLPSLSLFFKSCIQEGPGMVAYACNPSYSGATQEDQGPKPHWQKLKTPPEKGSISKRTGCG
jgi:hypothetical protein